MIETVIKDRMQVVGLTQAKLAELVGCTPTQIGLFLKAEASLNREALDKCFSVLGINIEVSSNRIKLAKVVAQKLDGYSLDKIKSMSKEQMAKITQIDAIRVLPDIDEKGLEDIVNSKILDYESTFPYFKVLVLHFMNVGDTLTPKTVTTSFESLTKLLMTSAMLVVVPSLIGIAVGALLANKTFSKVANNACAPLLSLTKDILKK